MENKINLTEMTEQQRAEISAQLRKEAQQLLNRANMVDSVKPIGVEQQKLIEQINEIGDRTAANLDGFPEMPEVGKINVQQKQVGDGSKLPFPNQINADGDLIIPIQPTEVDFADITLQGKDNGQGSKKITPLFMDAWSCGAANDKQRDCSKCAKWGKNHCIVKTPAPRRLNGTCDFYLELNELKVPRFIVKVHCPICYRHLGSSEISTRWKSARCYHCEVDIAGMWLSKNIIIEDLENGETNSNAKIEEIYSESPKPVGKD